jgi:NAD-reducing hydrogenase large subunit
MAEPKIIRIDPVTRIEGHAKISIIVNEQNEVVNAQFHVDEFRGFEKFCEGRLYTEMPVITPRICGICPVSHSLASAKACDELQRVQLTETGTNLRKLLQLGQILSSHALSFFYLSAPDLLLGWDSDPALRNIVGIAEKFPEIAKQGIRLRKFGQEISLQLTGKKIHTNGVIAGGVAAPLQSESRDELRRAIPEALKTVQMGLKIFKDYMGQHQEEVETFSPTPTVYMGLVGMHGRHEFYDGTLRWVGVDGQILQDQVSPQSYLDWIGEQPVEFSYLKYPFFKPLGMPQGIYRVGPLARLNICSGMKTPLAQTEWELFRGLKAGSIVHGTFYYHYARLIEMLTAIEQIEELLFDPQILMPQVHVEAKLNQEEGIGCTEAPRGTLFHHYRVDSGGKLTMVNLLIATGQNNPSMNQSILDIAKQYIHGSEVPEGVLNRIEAAIRCYDPCLSCSTHAMGQMPLMIKMLNESGQVLRTIHRD